MFCDYCSMGPRVRAVRREGLDSAVLTCMSCVGYAVNDFIARGAPRLTVTIYPPSEED